VTVFHVAQSTLSTTIHKVVNGNEKRTKTINQSINSILMCDEKLTESQFSLTPAKPKEITETSKTKNS